MRGHHLATMCSTILRYATVLIAFFMAGAAAFGQSDSLALSSGVATPGGTVSLNLSLSSPSGSEPAGIEWTFAYSASDIVAISASPGAAATAAGASLSCAGSSGSYLCFLTGVSSSGLDANLIQNGVVAVLAVTLSPASPGTTISVANALSSSAKGNAIQTTATGGTITVVPGGVPVGLTSLSCNPAYLASGASSTCTATLNQAASAGATITLSDNNAPVSIPASVTVLAGASSASFTATAGALSTTQSATITATLNGSSQAASLTLLPYKSRAIVHNVPVTALSCSPTGVDSGASTTCTVTLSQAAPTGGSVVALSDNSTALIVPSSATVPAGSPSVAFTATAGAIATSVTVILTANLNGVSQSVSLLLLPTQAVSSLSCNPTSLISRGSSTCTVTLNSEGVNPQTVALTSSSSLLTIPTSVPVPAEATSATFTATAGGVTKNQSGTITASLNGSATATLELEASVAAVACDSTSLNAGATTTCTITLSSPAPDGGVAVAVSSDGPALTVPASVSISTSSSTATFPVTAAMAPPSGQSNVIVTAALYGASLSVPFTVTICPCSVWSTSAQPANPDANDNQATEVGMQFVPEVSGYATGVRFFKALKNTGTHVGNLWSVEGRLLATVTFTTETPSGWQLAYFPSPVAVIASTPYVISYNAPQGHYAADNGFFTNALSNPPLLAPADGANGPNGVYQYGSGGFPAAGAAATNFWVDPVFNTSPTIGTAIPVSLWTPEAVPNTAAAPTSQAAQLGVTFISDVPGYVTGLRFYKSSANIGQHLGYLWTSTGTLLASVTFTNESASGWQQANFATPVAISANTPYVVSYWSPQGYYADDAGYFATSGVTHQMLYAPPNGQYGPNGSYATSNEFPASSSSSSNYWVDVVFTTAIQ